MSPPVSAAPPVVLPGHSVGFAVGTHDARIGDAVNDQVRGWADAVKAAAGPGCFVEALGEATISAGTIARLDRQARANPALTPPVLDKTFGKLRGHTLVFALHGLNDQTPGSTDAQGLMFRRVSARHEDNIVMTVQVLKYMVNDPSGAVVPDAQVANFDTDDPVTAKLVRDINDFAAVVDKIRTSIFNQIYLAACGGGKRLSTLAGHLKRLTGRTIFFNSETLWVPLPPPPNVQPYTVIGTDLFVPSMGKAFYSGIGVTLKSGTDTFLPGSTDLL